MIFVILMLAYLFIHINMMIKNIGDFDIFILNDMNNIIYQMNIYIIISIRSNIEFLLYIYIGYIII